MKKIIVHPILGEVTISQTNRATRLSLSVRPDGEVRLSYPVGFSHKRAMKFLDERIDWVTAHRQTMAEKHPVIAPIPITDYQTRHHTLRLAPVDTIKITIEIWRGEIVVRYPSWLSSDSEDVQGAIEFGIVEALRREAKEILPPMVERLAAKHGFRYGAVRIKAVKSKWGSCTARGDINLSLFLMLLPDYLVEYIVLHELCHTIHLNHSPKFHALLESTVDGQSKALNRELRAYRPAIRFRS
jgi:predicted metal-dependent hydrolase